MKKLLLLFLFIFCFALPVNAFNPLMVCTGAVASGGCGSCTTGNDSKIVVNPNTTDAAFEDDIWIAYKFTIASERCITGLYVQAKDDGTSRNITAEIYTNNAVADPDEPGSIVGAGYTGTYTNIPDIMGEIDVTFSETQTLSAGTYWAIGQAVIGQNIDWGYTASGSGTYSYSGDEGVNWSFGTYEFEIGVLGCVP